MTTQKLFVQKTLKDLQGKIREGKHMLDNAEVIKERYQNSIPQIPQGFSLKHFVSASLESTAIR